jgi:hypothetical protein
VVVAGNVLYSLDVGVRKATAVTCTGVHTVAPSVLSLIDRLPDSHYGLVACVTVKFVRYVLLFWYDPSASIITLLP